MESFFEPWRLKTCSNNWITQGRNEDVALLALVFLEACEVLLGNERTIAVVEVPRCDILQANNADTVVDVMRTLQVRAERAVLKRKRYVTQRDSIHHSIAVSWMMPWRISSSRVATSLRISFGSRCLTSP